MIQPSKLWMCDYCERQEHQAGPRGMAVPPVPPLGWYLVDIVKLVPERKVDNIKRPEELATVRKIMCPMCAVRVEPLLAR